jgi:tetratricopeptide (TPR) repeat protein
MKWCINCGADVQSNIAVCWNCGREIPEIALLRRFFGEEPGLGGIKNLTEKINNQPLEASNYYERGVAQYNRGDYGKAIEDCSKAIELKRDYVEAYEKRAEAFFDRRDFENADYMEIMKIDPGKQTDLINRGNECLNRKDYDRAIAYYSAVLGLYPDMPPVLVSRGNAYVDRRDYKFPIPLENYPEALRKSIKKKPYKSRNDYHKAILDYEAAININSRYTLAFYGLGMVNLIHKNYDAAISEFSKAVEFAPQYASAFCMLGDCWYNKKDYDNAIANYDKAIEIDPEYVYALGRMGDACRQNKDYDRAIASYGEYLKHNLDYSSNDYLTVVFLWRLVNVSKDKNASRDGVKDSSEYKISQAFLREFTGHNGAISIDDDGIIVKENDIDILVKGAYDNGEKFVLAIDATAPDTFAEIEQLPKHKVFVEKNYGPNEYKNREFVYFNAQVNNIMHQIREMGFNTFSVFRIYNLDGFKNMDNDDNPVLKNYYTYITARYKLFQKFKELPMDEWDDASIIGFFNYLSEKLSEDKRIVEKDYDVYTSNVGQTYSFWFSSMRGVANRYGEKISFRLSLEFPYQISGSRYFCRLLVRANGRANGERWQGRDIEQFIGSIGMDTRHMPGQYIILSQLFQIGLDSPVNYQELEEKTLKALEVYCKWQDDNHFEP